MLAGEQASRAAETGGDLVEDEQYVVPAAERVRVAEILGRIEPHPARTLHDRLQDERRDLPVVLREGALDLLGVGRV